MITSQWGLLEVIIGKVCESCIIKTGLNIFFIVMPNNDMVFFWYGTNYSIVLCYIHRLYSTSALTPNGDLDRWGWSPVKIILRFPSGGILKLYLVFTPSSESNPGKWLDYKCRRGTDSCNSCISCKMTISACILRALKIVLYFLKSPVFLRKVSCIFPSNLL